MEFGQQHMYLQEEVKRLIKQINIHIIKEPGGVMDLTFEGFVHFVLQYAYYVYADDQERRDEIRALSLVEKLFVHIRAQPKFKELGLHTTKLETTNRQQVELLQKLSN